MTKTVWIVIAAAAALLVVGAVVVVVAVQRSPWLIWDERACSDDEAPAIAAGGGAMCFPEGAALEDGWEWDPLGNRPLTCSHRPGWTEITRTDPEYGGTEDDCLKDGIEIPPGWSFK